MPSDEYASASAGGALRLKGGKVEKRKKHKNKHKKLRLEAAIREGKREGREGREDREGREKEERKRDDRADRADSGERDRDEKKENDDDPYARMTASERRFAEAQERKIRDLMHVSPDEARASHPELFKSHKERLADLNAYLSRMSEHHDMPKIGPG